MPRILYISSDHDDVPPAISDSKLPKAAMCCASANRRVLASSSR